MNLDVPGEVWALSLLLTAGHQVTQNYLEKDCGAGWEEEWHW